VSQLLQTGDRFIEAKPARYPRIAQQIALTFDFPSTSVSVSDFCPGAILERHVCSARVHKETLLF